MASVGRDWLGAAGGLLGLLAACSAVAGPAAADAADQRMEVQRLQNEAAYDRAWPRADYLVRSEAQWLEVWAQGQGEPEERGASSGSGRPSVDFERFMLVGVSRGLQGHGCSGLYIEDAVERSNEIEVRFVYPGVDDHLPGQPFKVCTSVMTRLVDWALLPRSVKPVRFVMVTK